MCGGSLKKGENKHRHFWGDPSTNAFWGETLKTGTGAPAFFGDPLKGNRNTGIFAGSLKKGKGTPVFLGDPSKREQEHRHFLGIP